MNRSMNPIDESDRSTKTNQTDEFADR